ncbi:MAG: nitroreductase family protein [Sneathiella sp.]
MTLDRIADHPVDPIFLNRWSPRAFDEANMPHEDLLSILEAARWAPSAFNIQPWRFLYSHRSDAYWQTYLSLLDDFNRSWAHKASALVFVTSDSMIPARDGQEGKLSRNHSFDAGAAWAQLALQATSLGYHAHAMAGIHFDAIKENLSIPPQYRVEIAIALGTRGDVSQLDAPLQERELPSERFALNELAFGGAFPND